MFKLEVFPVFPLFLMEYEVSMKGISHVQVPVEFKELCCVPCIHAGSQWMGLTGRHSLFISFKVCLIIGNINMVIWVICEKPGLQNSQK